jgi:4-amino-4-deoxy-L-arabinose transferase-like glycosyltransferase
LAAEAWLRHFPVVGTDHWATRHTVVLPVALSLAVFGQREFALALPSVLFFAGFLWLNFHFARRFLGERAAVILVMLLAATPEFIVQATYINNDIVEAFFASLSFWLFMAGTENGRASTILGAGAAAGLSFLTRETSAVLPIFYGACFLLDPRPSRKSYIYLALGFVGVVGAEMIYFGAMTGDFLYRYRMDASHDTVSRVQELRLKAKTGATLDRQGNLSVNVWADPFLMLFASQKFGLLFYLAIPAAIYAFRNRIMPPLERSTIRRVARLALLWILFISLAFKILYLVPRYYAVPAWASVLVIAYAFHQFSLTRHRRAAIAVLVAFLAVNALSFYLENTNPRFAERAMIAWLDAHPGTTVQIDPDMARRSDLLLQFAGVGARVRTGPPQTGQLFVFSPRNQELCKQQGLCKRGAYLPQPGWQQVDFVRGKPRAIGGVLRALHAARFIPPQILQKIESPAPGIVIYRVR